MSTNVSKQKRKDLTDKIKAIHKYIAFAKPDENTRNFLAWLSEIEKEISIKKFGLVFEEHWKAIDDTLETHTPVLTENNKLFIDNSGQINFLIEGDNLVALQLLLKPHKRKIDVTYIDPPYNTGAKNWKYDNNFVIETKGGFSRTGTSQDIDAFSEIKYKYLHQYISQNNLKGGFVRKDKKSQELFICTGEYSSDINSANWQLLSDVL
jgi:hypothetical protein